MMEEADRQVALLLQKQFDMEMQNERPSNFINESRNSTVSSIGQQEASSSRFKREIQIGNNLVFNKKRKYDDIDITKSPNNSSSDMQLALLLQQQLNKEIQMEKNKMDESDQKMAILLQKQFSNETDNAKSLNNSPDEQMAVILQQQFDMEVQMEKPSNNLVYDNKKNKYQNIDKSKSLIDPSWELVDPTPDIHILFIAFNQRFFWNKLLAVTVSWSKRMTTCAGICSYQGRSGLCQITLSEPLLKLRPRKDLVETLLHEMIHAFLFITKNDRDRDGHGPEFHKHMYRINHEAGTNITVYHDFHDEVKLYKQHWWRCDGPCQHRRPFYGYVKRSMNRAPGPNDLWWAEHQKTCGGNFTKIKEPEKPKKETKTSIQTKKVKANTSDIRNFFSDNKKINSNILSTGKSNIKTIDDIKGGVGGDKFGTKNKNGTVVLQPKLLQKDNSRNKENVLNYNKIVTLNDLISEPTNKLTKTNDCIVNNQTIKSPEINDYSAVRNHWLSKFDNVNNKCDNNQINKKTENDKTCTKIQENDNQNLNNKRKKENMNKKNCFGIIEVTSIELEEPINDDDSRHRFFSNFSSCTSDVNYIPSDFFCTSIADSTSVDLCIKTIPHTDSLSLITKKFASTYSSESVIPDTIDVEINVKCTDNKRTNRKSSNIESCSNHDKKLHISDELPCKNIQTDKKQYRSCNIQTDLNNESPVVVQEELLADILNKIKCGVDSIKVVETEVADDTSQCDYLLKTDVECPEEVQFKKPCQLKTFNKPKLIQCHICKNWLKEDCFDLHMSECLSKMYTDIENKYNLKTESEYRSNDLITCSYCQKTFHKKNLPNHLESCMAINIHPNCSQKCTEDPKESKDKKKKERKIKAVKSKEKKCKKQEEQINIDLKELICQSEHKPNTIEMSDCHTCSETEKKYNCPICTVPISLRDINKHIEECVGDNL